jgi:hypothetical protein
MIGALRRELAVVVALAAIALFAALTIPYARQSFAPGSTDLFGHDFLSFYAAARLAGDGVPVAAYDPARHRAMQARIVGEETGATETRHFYFGYPPTYLTALRPLAALSYPAAFAVFMAVGAALLAGALAAIAPGWRTLVFGFAAPVTLFTLVYGQNAWATAGLAGLVLVLLPRRPVVAGLVLALLTLKPQLGLAFPVLLIAGGHWRTVAAAAAGAVALAAASAVALGPEVWTAFLAGTAASRDVLMENSAVGVGRLQSVFGLVRLFGGPVGLAYAAQGLVAGAAAVVLVRVWRGGADAGAKAALALATTLVMTPFVLPYDLTLLVPAAAFLLAGRAGASRLAAAVVAAALLTLPAILWRPDAGVLFGLPALGLVYAAALAVARDAARATAGRGEAVAR